MLSSDLLFNSPSLGPWFGPVETLLNSFVASSTAPWTTEKAAEALVDNRPHIDLIPPGENTSVPTLDLAKGEGDRPRFRDGCLGGVGVGLGSSSPSLSWCVGGRGIEGEMLRCPTIEDTRGFSFESDCDSVVSGDNNTGSSC